MTFPSLGSLLSFHLPVLVAVGSCLYYIAVWVASLKFRLEKDEATGFTPPVSLLKPVYGIEPSFYANLASHCRQDYPQFELVVGINDSNDPARWTLAQLQHDFPQVPIKVIQAPAGRSGNPKMNTLQYLLEQASHDVVVLNDADIRVEPDYLRKVVGPLADERVGLVTCLYRGVPNRTPASVFEALNISGDFAGQVLLAQWIEKIKFALGATMATRKKQLAEIGGLARWSDYLADDYVLGNKIAEAGYRIHLSHVIVETVLPPRSFSELLRQQLRWARTIRFSRPRGYLGLLLTFGIPFAVLAAATHSHTGLALAILGVTIAARLLAAWSSGVLVCRDPAVRKFFWLLPLRDFIAFGIWVVSFWGATVVWRDERFKIEVGGKIRPA